MFGRSFKGTLDTLNTECLPTCFAGRLRTAPVVLLYLNPGLVSSDITEAGTSEAQTRYAERRKGNQPLDGKEDHLEHYVWWTGRTKVFGPPEIVRERVAFLNLVAYHSKNFGAHHAPAVLPSSRVTLDWAHEILFRDAINGKRVVVCMRAAAQWGLRPGDKNGQLFVPGTVRGGHMKKAGDHAVLREGVVKAVRTAIGTA